MKKFYSKFTFYFLLFAINALAQTTANAKKIDPYTHPIILSHYSTSDLLMLETTDSIRFKTIVYYYTQSFILEKIDCFDCLQVDLRYFDVSKVESFRKKNERYERIVDKYGVKMTLLATDELVYKMPIHIQ